MIKESIYDKFKCTADKCNLTCCKGWAVKVEESDVDKWKATEESHYLCEKIKKRKGDDGFDMRMDAKKGCVMLDESGLCNIVKKHGDEFLAKTCQEFPRKHCIIEEENNTYEEASLSGACPHVLELIYEEKDDVIKIPEEVKNRADLSYEYRLRNYLIDIFNNKSYELKDKIILALSFLHECLECEWEDDVYTLMDTYLDDVNVKDILKANKKKNIDPNDAFYEICQTFYDVTQYYKEEEMYRPYLFELSVFDETIEEDIDNLTNDWRQLIDDFKKYDEYMNQIITAEIFSDCISEDLGEVIENIQCIILEYIMTRVSVFFCIKLKKNVDIELIQNYMALFIRMIGHNIEGVCEYWIENFEDSILDMDYINTLIL